ncbi:MAG TPA: NrsF family protein [Steroidobacteraceae bacterium]|nr:NrsF family protein [Steroidobacteraceae bacterium]
MDTERLIEALASGLEPVQPLRSPAVRALRWLAVVAAVSLAVILRYADLGVFLHRIATPRVALECVATALTAITGILAAFQLSVPGRSTRWALLPLAPFLVWLGASGLGCLQNGTGGSARESMHCFVFIASASVPLAASLLWMLRRAHPIAPLPVATLGALGTAAMAAFVLEFFHPFDVTVIDLALHLAAVALVMAVIALLRRPLLDPDTPWRSSEP